MTEDVVHPPLLASTAASMSPRCLLSLLLPLHLPPSVAFSGNREEMEEGVRCGRQRGVSNVGMGVTASEEGRWRRGSDASLIQRCGHKAERLPSSLSNLPISGPSFTCYTVRPFCFSLLSQISLRLCDLCKARWGLLLRLRKQDQRPLRSDLLVPKFVVHINSGPMTSRFSLSF